MREEQPQKQQYPQLVRDDEISTDVREEQS